MHALASIYVSARARLLIYNIYILVYNIDSNLELHQIDFNGIIFSEILEALKGRVDCSTQVVDCYKMININFLTVDDEKFYLKGFCYINNNSSFKILLPVKKYRKVLAPWLSR